MSGAKIIQGLREAIAMTSELDAAALGVGRDVGTPAPEPAVTVTSTADVASAKVSPEAVKSALRSWRDDNDDGLLMFENPGGSEYVDDLIASLCRHVASALTAQRWLQQGFNGA